MTFKWFRNKLTFVIIPEVNGSVVRVKLSRAAVSGALAAIVLFIGIAVYVYTTRVHTAASTFQHNSELHGKAAQLEEALAGKDQRIEELENEIYSLSKQAAHIHSKVEAMKKLEQDLQKLTPGDLKRAERDGTAAVGSASPLQAMGGPAYPASDEEVQKLALATGQTYAALEQEIVQLADRFNESKLQLQAKQDQLARTPTLWPTVSRIVTSNYGYRRDPFTRKLSFHRGIDIGGKMNDPIYTTARGVVEKVGYDKLHGHNVIVEHSDGLKTWYMHLNSVSVRKGQRVDKGDIIGKLGTTGRSTGPHLHYEVLLGGKSTDPAPYFPKNREKKETAK
ncbi:M23 family metallopeptidase [Paenibacillus sp. YYML68]|uniref:M23 family metallopeptidase n=1 Tax=Paenibacillus sp. YYML68 TaxID=2909250 RepID=UPI00248F8109|nr:M23 family metallopeptidase [Paenibacillus sp. YYML68]